MWVTMKFLSGCVLGVAALVGMTGAVAQTSEMVSLYAGAKAYMDDPVPMLKTKVRELNGLKIETDQDGLAAILNKAGEVILEQTPRLPNLMAREDIAQEQVSAPLYQGNRTLVVDTRPLTTDDRLVPQSWRRFEYLILAKHQDDGGTEFDEYRKEVGKAHEGAPPRGIGFGSLWLIFVPSNVPESHFRYLGKQNVNKRPTFVVGFAQDPNLVKAPGIATMQNEQVPLLYQGIAWIDVETYKIVRIRTDLLAPLPGIQLPRLSSTVNFSEVRIRELDLPLWLPKEVEITWDRESARLGELHRYSDYRLFRATSRILQD